MHGLAFTQLGVTYHFNPRLRECDVFTWVVGIIGSDDKESPQCRSILNDIHTHTYASHYVYQKEKVGLARVTYKSPTVSFNLVLFLERGVQTALLRVSFF